MATRNITVVNVTTTPTQIVAANPARTTLTLRVDEGQSIWAGDANDVAAKTNGFQWSSTDGPINDGGAPDAALWGVTINGVVRVQVWESLA